MDENEKQDYEQALAKAQDAMAAAEEQATEAGEQLQRAAELLLKADGPRRQMDYHNGPVHAAEHIAGVVSKIEVLKTTAGSASKAARLRKKQADAAIYGIELLYADVTKAADASDGPLFAALGATS